MYPENIFFSNNQKYCIKYTESIEILQSKIIFYILSNCAHHIYWVRNGRKRVFLSNTTERDSNYIYFWQILYCPKPN